MADIEKDAQNGRESIVIKASRIHKEAFGIEPVMIGRISEDDSNRADNIYEAIDKGEPYNEVALLSPKNKEAYIKGRIFFD